MSIIAAEPGFELTFDPEHRYEWIAGRPREKPDMGAKANRAATVLARLLDYYAAAHKLGLVFTQECGYQIFANEPKKVRKPDVSFVARGRLPNDEPPDGHMTIPPDLAVEIVSPNDLARDIESRVDDYLKAGVKLLWVLHPSARSVHVLRADGSGVRLTEAGELSGEDVVSGFTCRVADLFVPF